MQSGTRSAATRAIARVIASRAAPSTMSLSRWPATQRRVGSAGAAPLTSRIVPPASIRTI